MSPDDEGRVMDRLRIAMEASAALRRHVIDAEQIHQPRKDHMTKPTPAAKPKPKTNLVPLPFLVTRRGLKILELAIGQRAEGDECSPELDGATLVEIAKEWLEDHDDSLSR